MQLKIAKRPGGWVLHWILAAIGLVVVLAVIVVLIARSRNARRAEVDLNDRIAAAVQRAWQETKRAASNTLEEISPSYRTNVDVVVQVDPKGTARVPQRSITVPTVGEVNLNISLTVSAPELARMAESLNVAARQNEANAALMLSGLSNLVQTLADRPPSRNPFAGQKEDRSADSWQANPVVFAPGEDGRYPLGNPIPARFADGRFVYLSADEAYALTGDKRLPIIVYDFRKCGGQPAIWRVGEDGRSIRPQIVAYHQEVGPFFCGPLDLGAGNPRTPKGEPIRSLPPPP